MIVTGCETVVFNGTLPKLTGFGLAEATLTPVPLTLNGIGRHEPPATGHSNTFVVPLAAPSAVGVKLSFTVHVPAPAPLHVPKSKWNGRLIPVPDASSGE